MKITISGIGGVGKGTTTKLLAEKLRYKTLSGGDFFREKAKKLGMSIYEFDQYIKENPEYDKELDKMQEEFGKENNDFILESRIGWYFVPDSFKIKLVCDEDERIKRVLGRDGGSIEKVIFDEKERLESAKERYEKLYNIKDFQADKNFDLVVDTTNNPPDEVVKVILESLKKS